MPPVDAAEATVRGRVQGVGFRPFVYRLARRLRLRGWVRNGPAGATVHVEGPPARLAAFRRRLARSAPPAARVEAIDWRPVAPRAWPDFRIAGSADGGGVGRVPADRATCPACRAELSDPADRRSRHPFANCTDCGPRYTILAGLPYDRPRTAMAGFPLCPDCSREYADPLDRRFHAQPIACPRCGPTVRYGEATGDHAVRQAAAELTAGWIVAVKGLGGFQLLVRADDEAAVRRLRGRKRRPRKPLAVMVRTLDDARRLGAVGPAEEELLASPENPIVLLETIPTDGLAASVAPRASCVGVLLPTTPLHHLLLAELPFPVVATSGNRAEEPIALDPEPLAGVADGVLTHDRPILRRADDSVVRVVAGRPSVVRVGRGYAPLPLPALERWAAGKPGGVLAVGGQQKAAVALWTGTQAVLGPHVGDLDDPDTLAAFERMTAELPDLYRTAVRHVAHDRHPDYASTRWAEGSGMRRTAVQHHHAHAAAVMAEHGLLDAEVLAFAWDGTGYGDDGTVWGGEVLRASVGGYNRVAHLRPFRLIGGTAAVREPARVALALLADADALDDGWRDRFGLADPSALLRLAGRGLHAPLCSSAGRLFDGVAALLEPVGRVSYEGEAAVWLESVAAEAGGTYPLPAGDWRPLVRAVAADVRAGVPVGVIAGRFHQALADWAAAVAAEHPGLPVILGGGCFQNRRLTERVRDRLAAAGRAVFQPEQVPANDGGLAAGQLAVALAGEG